MFTPTKMLLLAALCAVGSHAVALRSAPPGHLLSDQYIDYINNAQSLWTAGRNFPEDTPVSALQRRLGVHPSAHQHRLPEAPHAHHLLGDTPLPDSFDSRDHWPECKDIIGTIRDQENCGSCWAFAAVESMSDRTCIHSQGKVKVLLSPQDLVSCCAFCGEGCNGGYPNMAWNYWMYFGLVTGGDTGSGKGCAPYALPACYGKGCDAQTPACPTTCINSYGKSFKDDRHYGRSSYNVKTLDEEAIMREIYTNGPVEASISVYEDFYSYTKGVYFYVTGEYLGGHAVRVLGWGVEGGVKYWLIANSWNASWGLDGYFKMRRGTNECGVEESIAAGLPLL